VKKPRTKAQINATIAMRERLKAKRDSEAEVRQQVKTEIKEVAVKVNQKLKKQQLEEEVLKKLNEMAGDTIAADEDSDIDIPAPAVARPKVKVIKEKPVKVVKEKPVKVVKEKVVKPAVVPAPVTPVIYAAPARKAIFY
jgi:hypothetical protein